VASLLGAGDSDITLEVAVYPMLDQTVVRTAALWKTLHPRVSVRVTSRPLIEHHRALAEGLANGVGLPDVVGIEASYLSRFVALGGLEDLSEVHHADGPAQRIAPFALPAARNAAGALVALPADVAPCVLFYRKDLLDRAGVGEAELATWDGLVEAGRRLRAATGVALLAHLGFLVDLRARAEIPAGEGLYFDAGGAPRLRSPRFVAAFELARAARAANVDAGVDEDWSQRWIAALGGGAVAAEPCGCWLVGQLEDWIAPDTRGLWRTAPVPGGVHLGWGGSYYAIPKRTPNRDLAWEWMKFMCLDRRVQLGAFEHACAFPSLVDALDDPFLDEPLPFLGGQRARQQWRAEAAAIPAIPVHPLDTLAAGAVRSALRAVLEHGQDIGQALAEAERRVWRIVREGS
jgi:multiple sugar transport system substrate-binding protein